VPGPQAASSLRRCGQLVGATIQVRLARKISQKPPGSINMAEEPASNCTPSLDLGAEQLFALQLVGTVALPSPFPATGRIFVVRNPLPPQKKDKPPRKFHIKIVQTINDSCIITRFVDCNAVSLIRFQPASNVKSSIKDESPTAGTFSLDQEGVQKMVSDQQWNVIDERASHEIEPFPKHTGVVLVPETQPVLLRYEISVPAATSLEQLMSRGAACPHC
jgi:hypothetical protein